MAAEKDACTEEQADVFLIVVSVVVGVSLGEGHFSRTDTAKRGKSKPGQMEQIRLFDSNGAELVVLVTRGWCRRVWQAGDDMSRISQCAKWTKSR